MELEMVGTKLPRLTGQTAPDKLSQLEAWLRREYKSYGFWVFLLLQRLLQE
jgi:hypothetical protein